MSEHSTKLYITAWVGQMPTLSVCICSFSQDCFNNPGVLHSIYKWWSGRSALTLSVYIRAIQTSFRSKVICKNVHSASQYLENADQLIRGSRTRMQKFAEIVPITNCIQHPFFHCLEVKACMVQQLYVYIASFIHCQLHHACYKIGQGNLEHGIT